MLLNMTQIWAAAGPLAGKKDSAACSIASNLQGGSVGKQESVITIEGRQIKISNLDKVLYPKVGFTKGQVIDYFVRVAPVLLRHLESRPLTLKRYPNDVNGM